MDSEEDDIKNFIKDLKKKIEDSPDYKAPILLVTTEWYVIMRQPRFKHLELVTNNCLFYYQQEDI